MMTTPSDCPNSACHGSPYLYCPSCGWNGEAPTRSTITRAELKDIALSLGLTPRDVVEIVLTPREVRVTCIDKSAGPWETKTRTIPVVP